MASRSKRRSKALPKLPFSQKLVLNQWLISLFGINPLEYARPVERCGILPLQKRGNNGGGVTVV